MDFPVSGRHDRFHSTGGLGLITKALTNLRSFMEERSVNVEN